MANRDEIIQQFINITGAEDKVANFYLESSKWDIETAVSYYYAQDNEDVDVSVENFVDLDHDESGTADTAVNNMNVPTNSKSAGNVKTLSSLRPESDDEEEKGQAFYVGGSEHGAGQQILGPPRDGKKVNLQDLLRSAQEHGAEVVSSSFQHEDNSSYKPFSGSGYKLGDSSSKIAPSILQNKLTTDKPPEVTIRIRLWRNGFTVDDDPLRTLTMPEDMKFLETLSSGQVPSELLQKHRFSKINVDLEDRSGEDYVTPEKPRVVPFQGTGMMLGSPSPRLVQETSIQQTVVSASQIEVNESEPTTQLQLRLANNSRLVARFNYNHTVGDIRQHIMSQFPQYRSINFQLLTTFPNKVLSDDSVTLKDANLLNAVIVQRLV